MGKLKALKPRTRYACQACGHVEARWEVAESGRRRKYYAITLQGRAQLAEEQQQWQAVDATLRGIWQALSLTVPASHSASATPLPQRA